MKRILFCATLILAFLGAQAQEQAKDFTVTDCNGNNLQLFKTLDSGHVVVITWVMPCSSCKNGALRAQNAIAGIQDLIQEPTRVYHYVSDDYGNSSCSSVSSWCTQNWIEGPGTFYTNNPGNVIKMADYGSDGMPKVVVLGGPGRKVYYNAINDMISENGISNALKQALNEIQTGVGQTAKDKTGLYADAVSRTLHVSAAEPAELTLVHISGQKVYQAPLTSGRSSISMKGNPNGIYLAALTFGTGEIQTFKFILNP